MSDTQDLEKITDISTYKEQRKAQEISPDAQFLVQVRLHLGHAQQCVKNAYAPLATAAHPSAEQFRKSAKLLKAAQESIQSLHKLLVDPTLSRPKAIALNYELIMLYINIITPQIKLLLANLYKHVADNISSVSRLTDALSEIDKLINN